MRNFSIFFSVVFAMTVSTVQAKLSQDELNDFAKNTKWTWEIIDNHHNKAATHLLEIELTNNSSVSLPKGISDWAIYTNVLRPIVTKEVKGLKFEFVQGDLYRIVPTERFLGLSTGEKLALPYEAANFTVSYTDFMPRTFIVQEGLKPAIFASTDTENSLQYVKPATQPTQYQRYSNPKEYWPLATGQWRYERYLSGQKYQLSSEQAQRVIIPTPEEVVYTNGYAEINAGWVISYQGRLKSEANMLVDALSRTLGEPLSTQADHIPVPKSQVIKLKVNPKVAESKKGGYELSITKGTIEIVGADNSGVFYGIQSLLNVVPAGKMSTINVPTLAVKDSPRFEWRGFMYDMGRNFHGVAVTKQLIDQMARYKLNKLHLHLTEDEAWRIEIAGLSELTELGSKRCFDLSETECLLPIRGAGPMKGGKNDGYYSREEFIDILKYAAARHIEVIPEIDMPGHARAAIKSMELRYKRLLAAGKREAAKAYLLSDPQDQSIYSTMQYFTDNSVNVCMDSTYNFVNKVAYELQQMYREAGLKLSILHLGGDEVGTGSWTASPICDALYLSAESQVKGPADLKAYFTARASKVLAKRGVNISAWEDGVMYDKISPFPIEQYATEEVYVNAWDNIWEWGVADRAYRLANEGYKTILSAGTHLYFDHPQEPHPEERGLYWASRFTDVKQVFGFMPDHLYDNAKTQRSGKPILNLEDLVGRALPQLQKPENIVGIQGQVWSETVRTPKQLTQMVFPRAIALAERAWHQAEWEGQAINADKKQQDWGRFASVLAHKEYGKLSEAGINVYVPVPGAKRVDGKVHLNSQLPGLTLEYSLDSGQSWQTYLAPFESRRNTLVRARFGKQFSRVGAVD